VSVTQFHTLDVDDPLDAQIVGTVTLPRPVRAIDVSDHDAYAALERGLAVIDISVPSAPVVVGEAEIPSPTNLATD